MAVTTLWNGSQQVTTTIGNHLDIDLYADNTGTLRYGSSSGSVITEIRSEVAHDEGSTELAVHVIPAGGASATYVDRAELVTTPRHVFSGGATWTTSGQPGATLDLTFSYPRPAGNAGTTAREHAWRFSPAPTEPSLALVVKVKRLSVS